MWCMGVGKPQPLAGAAEALRSDPRSLRRLSEKNLLHRDFAAVKTPMAWSSSFSLGHPRSQHRGATTARAKARLGQSVSAAQHTEGHLQVVGVGEWRPTSTRPAWNAEPRLPGSEDY